MNVQLAAGLMVRSGQVRSGRTYLKWRSWQFRAKDVTGIPGLAGQPWPEITVLVRSHWDCVISSISQSFMSPQSSQCKCADCLYSESGQPCPASLPVYPIKTSWLEARVVTAGKGGEGGKVLDNLKREIDQSWPGLVWLSYQPDWHRGEDI